MALPDSGAAATRSQLCKGDSRSLCCSQHMLLCISIAVHQSTLTSQSKDVPGGSFCGQHIAALHQVTILTSCQRQSTHTCLSLQLRMRSQRAHAAQRSVWCCHSGVLRTAPQGQCSDQTVQHRQAAGLYLQDPVAPDPRHDPGRKSSHQILPASHACRNQCLKHLAIARQWQH